MRAAGNMTLISALAARTPMYSADLFTLSLADTTSYHWTSADRSITLSGVSFSALGPKIDRSSWGAKNTTEVPEMVVQIYSGGNDFGAGNNLMALAHAGLFDGAYLLLQRVFMPTFGDTALGAVTLFGGLAGAAEINALGIKLTCTASNVSLEQNLPRRTYQANCMHTLYDAQCTLLASDFTSSFTVFTANAIALNWTVTPADPTLFLFGTMHITSGAGAGQVMTVRSVSASGVQFGYPLSIVPAAGDTFSLQQGCAKTLTRCQAFANIQNFGGFPYIPAQSLGV